MQIKNFKKVTWTAGVSYFRHFRKYLADCKRSGMKIDWEEMRVGFFGLLTRKYTISGEAAHIDKITATISNWVLI